MIFMIVCAYLMYKHYHGNQTIYSIASVGFMLSTMYVLNVCGIHSFVLCLILAGVAWFICGVICIMIIDEAAISNSIKEEKNDSNTTPPIVDTPKKESAEKKANPKVNPDIEIFADCLYKYKGKDYTLVLPQGVWCIGNPNEKTFEYVWCLERIYIPRSVKK